MWMSGTASFRLRWPLRHVSHLGPMMIMFFRVGHSPRHRFTQVLQPILTNGQALDNTVSFSYPRHTHARALTIEQKNQVIGVGAHAHAHRIYATGADTSLDRDTIGIIGLT